MSCVSYYPGVTVIHRLDPRSRILVTLLFALTVAVSSRFPVMGAALLTGVVMVVLARIPGHALWRRLWHLNLFTLALFIFVPFTTPGEAIFQPGPLSYSWDGFLTSATIALKANAIVLVFTALLGTVEPFTLGHAFHQLRVHPKLIHLFLFTVRYLDVLHHEYLSLLRALKARAFRPRLNLHTYRTYANLTAILLVRSLERSERVLGAMRCRGFQGRFHALTQFELRRRDLVFFLLACLVSGALVFAQFAEVWL